MELVNKFCAAYDCGARMFNGMLVLTKGNRSVKVKGFGQMSEEDKRKELIKARATLHLVQVQQVAA
jgi:hypothetical protein